MVQPPCLVWVWYWGIKPNSGRSWGETPGGPVFGVHRGSTFFWQLALQVPEGDSGRRLVPSEQYRVALGQRYGGKSVGDQGRPERVPPV